MKDIKRSCDIDCWNEDHIICPYCYEEIEDSENWVASKPERLLEIECPYCEKTFYCESEWEVKYTSTRMGNNREEIREWEDD